MTVRIFPAVAPYRQVLPGQEDFAAPIVTSAAAAPTIPVEQSAPPADAPFLLIGVITSPASFGRRRMLREFAKQSAAPAARKVTTEFVFGNSLFEGDLAVDGEGREAHVHPEDALAERSVSQSVSISQ